MSKLAYSLSGEKQDLQKQLGCMTGIFQLFDRRHFLRQQRSNVHNHKRLPPPGESGNSKLELNNAPEKVMEKDARKVAKEKQRVSMESSRTSFSSTCSSTEPPSSGRSIFPEATSPITTVGQPNPSLKPLDLRDIVKDSMYREARAVLVKTVAKEEGMSCIVKHIDSPRPMQQQQKSVQPRAYSLDRSNRNLAKLRETDVSVPLRTKDAPRFSYDGRESRDKLKSSIKLKELPRLSLDSRESSIRRSAVESRQINLPRETQILNLDQEQGSNKRPSGVVARLMGLEALPDPVAANQGEILKTKPQRNDDLLPISTSSRMGEEVKHTQKSSSPRIARKETVSPRMGHSSSRLPLEPAPWKQEGGSQGSQKPAPKYKESPTSTPSASSPSVYGEIEKRLTDLEFKKSGKDLRALKQILEAMQKTRKRLEVIEQPFESQTSKCILDNDSQQTKQPLSPSIRMATPPKSGEFPIMVIKPAKFIGKPRISDNTVVAGLQKLRTTGFSDDQNIHLRDTSGGPLPPTDKKSNARAQRSAPSTKVTENITGEKSISSRRNSGSGSPRQQQKRQGMEKKSSPSGPSDFSRVRNQSNKQPIRSDSTRKIKQNSTNLQQKDDQSCGFSCETRDLSQQGDTVSLQSDSNTSLASKNDTEVTSRDWTCKISTYQPMDPNANKCTSRLNEDSSIAELATATLEQPSPVSVLDATFYCEDSPSPVKKISNAFKDYDTLNCYEAEWKQKVSHNLLSSTINSWPVIDHGKLKNIRQLVHDITLLSSSHIEATTKHKAVPCENMHPDHRYISQILFVSGFLQYEGSSPAVIQLHSSGHLIDPSLFHVLEKSKECVELENWSKSSERNRRKLIFDTVNEILVHKLGLTESSKLWTFSNKARGRSLSGEKLLEEVWSEISTLEVNSDSSLDDEDDELISIIDADVNQKSADWDSYRGDLPGLVLDIERMIFKDLISEVVSGGDTGLQDQTGRYCRQLFSK